MPTRSIGLLLPLLFACSHAATTDSYGGAPIGGEPNESAQRAVSQMEDEWAKALESHDTTFLAKVVAPDFRATGDSGAMFGRAELLRDVADTATQVSDVRDHDRQVRIYGNGTVAVVSALGTWKVAKDGSTEQMSGRYTEVWVKRNDGWKVVSGHYSDAPPPASQQ
jgi:uncharacterized protein (TIGR02246 family)